LNEKHRYLRDCCEKLYDGNRAGVRISYVR
jgi:hypothetical protein